MDQIYNVNDIGELKARIKLLEAQRKDEWKAIKDHVSHQYDQLRPSNLIHNAFNSMAETLDSDGDVLKEGAALASSLLVNSIMGGSKNKPMKKWLTLVIFSVASYFISRHKDDIVEAGSKFSDYIGDRLRNAKANRAERKRRREAEEEQGED